MAKAKEAPKKGGKMSTGNDVPKAASKSAPAKPVKAAGKGKR